MPRPVSGVGQHPPQFYERQREEKRVREALERLGPIATFPWHTQQLYALRSATDVIAVIGGNRSGKSETGKGAVARLARREGPIYGRLRNREGRVIRIWVAPQTFEKYKSLWEGRIKEALEGMEYTYVQSPHPVFRIQDGEGGIEIWGKAQEQGFLSFESDDVDFCIFDEEPEDPRVFRSAQVRMATTNGVVMLTFTPLLGMSWTYQALYKPAVHSLNQIADRVFRVGNALTVITMGMADNPSAVEGGGVQRMKDDPSMTEAERNARLYGTYGYTEGLLISGFATLYADSTECPYLLDELPRGRSYSWLLTADPNKRHGALLSAWDDAGNRYYCAEHYAEGLPDSVHAGAYREMLQRFGLRAEDVPVYADPGGAGAQAIINLAETGFYAQAVPKDPGSVSASIKRIRRAAWIDPTHLHPVTGRPGAPRVYFLRSLNSEWDEGGVPHSESRLMWEFRKYRQKEPAQVGVAVAPDTPIKKDDDVVDCARYAELVRMIEPDAPVVDYVREARKGLDHTSRQEAEAFEKVIQSIDRRQKSRRVQWH